MGEVHDGLDADREVWRGGKGGGGRLLHLWVDQMAHLPLLLHPNLKRPLKGPASLLKSFYFDRFTLPVFIVVSLADKTEPQRFFFSRGEDYTGRFREESGGRGCLKVLMCSFVFSFRMKKEQKPAFQQFVVHSVCTERSG